MTHRYTLTALAFLSLAPAARAVHPADPRVAARRRRRDVHGGVQADRREGDGPGRTPVGGPGVPQGAGPVPVLRSSGEGAAGVFRGGRAARTRPVPVRGTGLRPVP